jgi:DnaJ-class molecular chaperone
LNVEPGATREAVTAAYRQMAKLYHPDKVAALAGEFRDLAEMRMKEINAAYQQLTR